MWQQKNMSIKTWFYSLCLAVWLKFCAPNSEKCPTQVEQFDETRWQKKKKRSLPPLWALHAQTASGISNTAGVAAVISLEEASHHLLTSQRLHFPECKSETVEGAKKTGFPQRHPDGGSQRTTWEARAAEAQGQRGNPDSSTAEDQRVSASSGASLYNLIWFFFFFFASCMWGLNLRFAMYFLYRKYPD